MSSTSSQNRFRSSRLAFACRTALVATAFAVLSGPPPTQGQTVPAPQQPTAPAPTRAADDGTAAVEVRARVEEVLRRYPPALRQVLRHDPQLLSDQGYLAAYPALADLIARYPQIARDPIFYFGSPGNLEPRDAHSEAITLWRNVIESASIFAVFALVITGLAWLIRTVLDHRRWLRATRVHVDVQQKLLDRLTTSDDLVAWIQTPAGQRLLEASPAMPSETSGRAVTAPVNRILWSVQIGVVLIPLGLGLQWVGRHVVEEVAQFLWFSGVLAVTVGIGFVLSAAVAYLISRRLGLIDAAGASTGSTSTEPAA